MKIHDLLQKQFEASIMAIHLAPLELSNLKNIDYKPL